MWRRKALRVHSADRPFPTLSSDYGSASCPSSCSPPWSHVSALSLVRRFRLFLECHLFFLQLLCLFSPFLSFHHQLPCFFLSGNQLWLYVSGVSLYLATCYQPSCFISPFLLSLKGHRGNGASWPLALCGAKQQSCILWRGEGSVFYSVHWEFRDGKLTACIWPAGEWFGFRVLKDLWKTMS